MNVLYVSEASSDANAAKLAEDGKGMVVVLGNVDLNNKVDNAYIDLVNNKIANDYKINRILFRNEKIKQINYKVQKPRPIVVVFLYS